MIPYLERLDAPVIGTTYYKANNDENDMPNCTKYCHDRAQEAVGNTQLRLFTDIGIKGFPMADKWLAHSALPVSDTPKLGSICCCSGNSGSIHVFFLERQNSDGTWLISDSRSTPDKTLRNDRFWRLLDHVKLEKGKTPVGVPGVGTILGFQIVPINDIRVGRDVTRSQVEFVRHRVHCRTAPGMDADILNPGCYVPQGIYNVVDTITKDGYTWCKLMDGAWAAADSSWANLYLVDPAPTPTPTPTPQPTPSTDLKTLFALVEKEINALESENNELKSGIRQMYEIAGRLINK